MIKALEADGFKVERLLPKGPVMEPVDDEMTWYWFALPNGVVKRDIYSCGNWTDQLLNSGRRIFHTEAEAIERNEQGAKGEWRMIHVPTFLQDLWDIPGVEVPVAQKIEKLFHPQP